MATTISLGTRYWAFSFKAIIFPGLIGGVFLPEDLPRELNFPFLIQGFLVPRFGPKKPNFGKVKGQLTNSLGGRDTYKRFPHSLKLTPSIKSD